MTDQTAPTLRAGIISDVHIGFTGHINPHYYGLGQGPVGDQDLWWEYSLRWFSHRGVDVIVVPGDMTNACDYSVPSWSAPCSRREMERFCVIFRKVFAGTDTQLVTIYGNHDDFVQAEETANGGASTHWQDVFGEPYAPVVRKTVHGFAFVGAHWGHEAQAGPAVAEAVADGRADRGVLICGTGVGMCITANKFRGVRAACCYNEVAAELSRRHNDANVLCLAGDFLSETTVEAIVRLWLTTPFDGGRHQRRVSLIDEIEKSTGL